ASLRERAAEVALGTGELPPFRDWITGLVPANPIEAAARGAILPLVVFSVIFALALTRLPVEGRRPVVRFFEAVRDAMLVLVGWILAVGPLGVFCLVLPIAARLGAAFAGVLGYVVLVVCGLLVVSILALYPVAVLGGRVPLRRFAAACAPAQAVAFSTRSSLASLPPLIEAAERRLRLPVRVTGLVLPLAVSTFKFASPIARITETLFVARLYGIDLGAPEVAAISAAIGLLSFYSPGVPSGGLFVMAPIYIAFGLPVEGIGLLLALDLIPDMFITTSNITADMTVAVLLARRSAPAEEILR
ncbi:MAG: dicarboxylate/amino acid:cation symporter, partial [Gemmatimonadota bacterium]